MSAHVASYWPRFLIPIEMLAAFDLDGDGVPEFSSQHDLVRRTGGMFRAVYNVSPGYFDCPC